MKVLITGGFGYLGSYCSKLFHGDNYEVTILARKIPVYMKEWAKQFKVIIGDISDDKLVEKINEQYDVVIQFASANDIVCKTNPREALDINVYGTRNLLDLCVKKNINKFIYLSTFHVYGKNAIGNVSEETKVMPINDYGLTHYFAELYCEQYSRNYDIKSIVLRPSNFYTGPLFNEIDRWSLVPNNFIMQILNHGEITINSSGLQVRNFISIKDLYKAIIIAMTKDINESFSIFNVGSNNYYTINEVASKVQKQYEIFTGRKINVKNKVNGNETEKIDSYIYDISKIDLLGYSSIDKMDEEIYDTISSLLTKKING